MEARVLPAFSTSVQAEKASARASPMRTLIEDMRKRIRTKMSRRRTDQRLNHT
jgi:hypothetical protein